MRVILVRLAIISVSVAFVCVGVSNAQNLATKKPSIEIIQVSENIYMLRGIGGNVGVVKGTQRTIIIDGQFAHAFNDIAVFFTKSNVIVTGDLYFVGVTPFIDTQSGGTYQGYLLAMKSILDRADQDTKIIPGHGPLTNKSTMQRDYESLQEFDPTSLD
jgi:glyoxylase-like metal-dependent hydrolase (beta-lactamase superfamily II)